MTGALYVFPLCHHTGYIDRVSWLNLILFNPLILTTYSMQYFVHGPHSTFLQDFLINSEAFASELLENLD